MNRDDKKFEMKADNPFDSANALSRFSYWWIIDILRVGWKKPFVEDDVSKCCKSQKSSENFSKFKKIWHDEQTTPKPNLVKSIMRFCVFRLFLIGIPISILELVCK